MATVGEGKLKRTFCDSKIYRISDEWVVAWEVVNGCHGPGKSLKSTKLIDAI